MNNPTKKVEWAVWGGLAVIIAVVGGAFAWSKLREPVRPMPIIGQIPAFTLTNQDNQPVSLANLRGQVWVADVIFTRCPGPCAKMTREFAKLQATMPASGARLVTFTSDPDYDSPAKLKDYAAKFGADTNRWWFLTGNKQEIRSLAVNDLKFVVLEKEAKDREVPDDLFIHSTWFVIVDKQGRLRGWTDKDGQVSAKFDLEDPDVQAQMLAAIKQLEKEPAL